MYVGAGLFLLKSILVGTLASLCRKIKGKAQRENGNGWMKDYSPPQSRYTCFEVRCFSLFIPEVGVQTLLFPANGKYK